MKKAVIVLLVVVMLFAMFGCGSKKPNDKYSEETVVAIEAAIEALDSFLGYDISANEARDKLERIEESLDTSDLATSIVSTSISTAGTRLGIYDRNSNSENFKAVQNSRDTLYDYLYG